MKKNHNKLIRSIIESINSCGEDDVLNDAKRHLTTALHLVEKVAHKRIYREKEREQFEEAKNKRDEWWAKIKEGLDKIENINPDSINIDNSFLL